MAVNWALGLQQGPNAGEQFAGAFHQGQERARQNKGRAAMAALARDPTNKGALAALAEADPETAMRLQQQLHERSMKDLEQFQGTIKTAAEMLRNLKTRNPQLPDAEAYSVVRQSLIRMGAPGADHAPEQFDQGYFNGILSLADPEKGQQSRFVPVPQGGSVLEVAPDGSDKWRVMPNGPPPADLTDDDIMRLEGGQSQPGSGGFLGPY
jgi:hypothetical protein